MQNWTFVILLTIYAGLLQLQTRYRKSEPGNAQVPCFVESGLFARVLAYRINMSIPASQGFKR